MQYGVSGLTIFILRWLGTGSAFYRIARDGSSSEYYQDDITRYGVAVH